MCAQRRTSISVKSTLGGEITVVYRIPDAPPNRTDFDRLFSCAGGTVYTTCNHHRPVFLAEIYIPVKQTTGLHIEFTYVKGAALCPRTLVPPETC